MLDTRYLYQPHGPGTAYLFRMRTPAALVGRPNPRTGKPYKGEIKEGMSAVVNASCVQHQSRFSSILNHLGIFQSPPLGDANSSQYLRAIPFAPKTDSGCNGYWKMRVTSQTGMLTT